MRKVVTKHADHGPTGLGVYWWQGHCSSSMLDREAFVQTPESGEEEHCIRLRKPLAGDLTNSRTQDENGFASLTVFVLFFLLQIQIWPL